MGVYGICLIMGQAGFTSSTLKILRSKSCHPNTFYPEAPESCTSETRNPKAQNPKAQTKKPRTQKPKPQKPRTLVKPPDAISPIKKTLFRSPRRRAHEETQEALRHLILPRSCLFFFYFFFFWGGSVFLLWFLGFDRVREEILR